MKQHKQPLQNKVRFVLSSLCIMLIIILWFELNTADSIIEEIDQGGSGTVSKDRKPDIDVSIFPEIVAFDEVIQRPLFSETRLPFVAPELEQTVAKPRQKTRQSPKKQEQLSLSAVVITPDQQIAILQSGRNKSLQRIALGELIDGWTLEDVTSHSIRLKKGEETKNLELEIKGSKSKPESKSTAKVDMTKHAEIPQNQVLTEKEGADKNSSAEVVVGKK